MTISERHNKSSDLHFIVVRDTKVGANNTVTVPLSLLNHYDQLLWPLVITKANETKWFGWRVVSGTVLEGDSS